MCVSFGSFHLQMKKMSRRVKFGGIAGIILTISAIVATFFGGRATVNMGTVEVKDAIAKSTSTSVGMDNTGHSILQDVHTSQQVSVRGYGDPFATETKVDPTTGRKLHCMNIGEVAVLFHDAVSRTVASISFMDENGIESEVVPVNGHFVDHGRTLHFGTGEDSVTMIMDSDACNTGVLPTDLEDVQDDSQAEPQEDEADDTLVEDEDEQYSDTGVFKRGLHEPSSDVAIIPVNLSRNEVLDRHRSEFAMAKDAASSGRKMNTVSSVEVSSDHCSIAPCTGTDAFIGNTATTRSCGSCNGYYTCQNNSGEVGENSCRGKYSCKGNTGTVGSDSW